MKINEKKQITDILNAFRLINKDIRKSFDIMSNKLETENNFIKWKKWAKENNKPNFKDSTYLFNGDDWYYLNCYGLYNKKVVGFTFVISINYIEKDDIDYADFLRQLDKNINLNTPMLCIFGIYSPIDLKNIKLLDQDDWQYVDDILQFTGNWNNYKKENIKYDKWLDVEVEYLENNKTKEGYEGWYKSAKIKINHITDFSKETAKNYIEKLIKKAKTIK